VELATRLTRAAPEATDLMGVTVTTSTSPPRARRALMTLAVAALAAVAIPTPTPAGAVTSTYIATGRVSVTSTGAQRSHVVGNVVAISAEGRYAAFTVDSALVAGDTNGEPDVYVRDRLGGTSTRVSLTDADTQIQGASTLCGMSRDSRFVAFVAAGTGLPVPGSSQVYLRDRLERETILVSVDSDEQPSAVSGGASGIWPGQECAVSDNGGFVAFMSEDGDLAPAASYDGDVFRRDLENGTTQLVNAGVNGGVPNGSSWDVAMSADGATVAFTSEANNLVGGDTNGDADVFVRSFTANATGRVSVKTGGGQVDGPSHDPSITAGGTRVAFTSSAIDLVAGDTNGVDDVFLRDRTGNQTLRVSLTDGFTQLPHGGSSPSISDNARYVAFAHYADADLPGDTNHDDDVRIFDVVEGEDAYISVSRAGPAGNDQSYGHAMAAGGTAVAFRSDASDLVRNDTNTGSDVFVRDLYVRTTPFADRTAFVVQQFQDFVGRAPTAAEVEAWSRRLDNGEIMPEEMIDELAHAPAWAGKRAPVIRLYWAFFLRVPDKAGMDYWIGEANKGLSLSKMASKFAASQEFKTKYGSLSNAGFVTAIYQNVFDRDPEPAGLAYWKGQLDTGKKTRGDVMVGFSESAEGRLLLSPAVDSVLVWLGMMRTVPPSSWSVGGVKELYDIGHPPEIVPQAILARDDYADRVS
jgi:Tol biopolymer transport system component